MKRTKKKPSRKLIKAFERVGVSVAVDEDMTRLTYYTKHGGEECEEIPHDADIEEWLENAYDSYDPSYEAYIWLDEFGHGKNGAPHDMRDVLSDKEEWEQKLEQLAQIASSANRPKFGK